MKPFLSALLAFAIGFAFGSVYHQPAPAVALLVEERPVGDVCVYRPDSAREFSRSHGHLVEE